MKTLVVGAAALILAGTALGAGAGQKRYLPFTLLGGDEIATGFGTEPYPSHPPLLIASRKAGVSRLMRLVKPEDQERLRQVDLRQSIIVAAFADYNSHPDLCRKNLTLRRIRLIQRHITAIATVENENWNGGCGTIPEVTGAHLYSLATFPRRFSPKAPRPGYLLVYDVPAP